jgi:hypothetical protein
MFLKESPGHPGITKSISRRIPFKKNFIFIV